MKVEIWSDVVCPWCYIGKRRLEAALERFEHRAEVEVIWRSFELDPTAPAELAQPTTDRLAERYGVSREQALAMQRRVADNAAAEGIDMRVEDARSCNTFDAHRVLHLARERGVQSAVKERLLAAHFNEGELLSDHGTLVRLAAEAGLAKEDVADVLAGDDHAEAVRQDHATARSLGATGVPFFVLDRAFGVSGAQPSEVLLDALQRAWSAGNPLQVIGGGDGACADGSCEL